MPTAQIHPTRPAITLPNKVVDAFRVGIMVGIPLVGRGIFQCPYLLLGCSRLGD